MNIMSLQRNEIPIEKTIVHKQNTKGLHYWDRNETRYKPPCYDRKTLTIYTTNENEKKTN